MEAEARSAHQHHSHRAYRTHGADNITAKRTRVATTLCGLAALLWLILRTGGKPSRFSYPCQQSAFAAAAAAFGAPLAAAIIAGRLGLLRFMQSAAGKLCGGLLALSMIVLLATASFDFQPAASILSPPGGYSADVYFVPDARGATASTLGGVDDLITLMGVSGMKLHQSETTSLTGGPSGIIQPNDVVLIKVNAQWAQRGGTNTDVLRGIIRNIVEHPDGFQGEIIVADNGQNSGNLNRLDNNAEDISQSPQDVVADFVAEGYHASTYLWDNIRTRSVSEFDTGDYQAGFVVDPVMDPETSIKVSYAKFTTGYGTHVSYKHGIWDETSQTYDAERLVVINVPVLKTHSIYGVTAAVKNHMGVVTTGVPTDSHLGVGRGGLGTIMAEVRTPDLNILDCIWVLAKPGSGPSASYAQSSNVNQLVASTDPVALDAWAVKHILMPQIIANGYSPGQYIMQDPDNPASKYRQYLDLSMNELLLGGRACSNDYTTVNLHTWAGDLDRDGDLDIADFAGLSGCLGYDPELYPWCAEFDYDLDAVVDLRDAAQGQNLFTGSLH